MEQSNKSDRYVSFCGLECDKRADELIDRLKTHLSKLSEDSLWKQYFQQKITQQEKLNHDNLYFVGAQLNNLYSLFDDIGDKEGYEMLWYVEQHCC